jgi:hypothetical protein
MLFVSPNPSRDGFWDEVTQHRPPQPLRHALAVAYGWFRAPGIGPGDLCNYRLPEGLVVR